MKIGIFDSGVGGLGIFNETKKLMPKASIIYLADSANCPYGEKNTKQIQAICKKNVDFLINKGAEIIVVACNSASVSALNWLRTQYLNIPIIGVVPVVKTAAKMAKNKKVAILATKRTVESKYLHVLVEQFCPKDTGYKIYYQACGELVDMVEEGDDEKMFLVLTKCLKPILKEKVDVVVLGCTHFPFAYDAIKKVLGRNIKILDSNAAVARQVKRIINIKSKVASVSKPEYQFYTSGNADKISKVARKLLRDQKIKFIDKK